MNHFQTPSSFQWSLAAIGKLLDPLGSAPWWWENDCRVASMHCFPISGCKEQPTAWGFPPFTTWWTPGSTVLAVSSSAGARPFLAVQLRCLRLCGYISALLWGEKLGKARKWLAMDWEFSKIRNSKSRAHLGPARSRLVPPLVRALGVGSTGTRTLAKQRCQIDDTLMISTARSRSWESLPPPQY